MNLEIINVSSKGQVVLPSEMRAKLDINCGDKLIVFCGDDSILIKKVKLPSEEEIEKEARKNIKAAKKAGLTEEDLAATIRESRKASRKK